MGLDLQAVVHAFLPKGEIIQTTPINGGLINDSYRVSLRKKEGVQNYFLQRLNTKVFPNTQLVMDNISLTADHLLANGYPYAILSPMRTSQNETLFVYGESVFRMFPFIDGQSHINPPSEEYIYQAGFAFGSLIKQLSTMDVSSIGVVIPDFHSPRARWNQYMQALEADQLNRTSACRPFVEKVNLKQGTFKQMAELLDALPTRIVHNDAKLTNILFQKGSSDVSAIVDWDTIMPGSVITDFGDLARTLCATADEEEVDFEKVSFHNPSLLSLKAGFVNGLDGLLTPLELASLSKGVSYIILEQCIRFLTDHLNGDQYYSTAYENQNLARARNQWALYSSFSKLMA